MKNLSTKNAYLVHYNPEDKMSALNAPDDLFSCRKFPGKITKIYRILLFKKNLNTRRSRISIISLKRAQKGLIGHTMKYFARKNSILKTKFPTMTLMGNSQPFALQSSDFDNGQNNKIDRTFSHVRPIKILIEGKIIDCSI